MEKIEIKIPQGLSKSQEAFMIGKILTKNLLGTKYCKEISAGYDIQHLQTQILITREPQEEVTVTRTCNCCQTIYDISIGITLYHNYGGLIKQMTVCSNECKDFVLLHFGDRITDKKKNVKPVFLIPSNYREIIKLEKLINENITGDNC